MAGFQRWKELSRFEELPIMETGLENLTQDSVPALIHFADGQTQQWLMVRIPEPKQ